MNNTILGSDNFSSYETNIININGTFLNMNNININNNIISGLNTPTQNNSSVNKEYVLNKFNLNKNITYIDIGKSITYDPSYIFNGYINRYISSNIIDIFPSKTDIINYKNTNNIPINNFISIIQNLSNINILSINIYNNIININPETFLLINLLIIDNNLYYYYQNNNNIDISEYIYKYNNNLIINNVIRTNKLVNNTNVYTINTNGLYLGNYVINSILTRTTIGGNDTFPTFIDILNILGPLDNQSSSFYFTLRNATNSFIYLYNNTGIIFNFSVPLNIDVDSSVKFNITYNNNIFIVTILCMTGFNDACILS